MVINISRCPPLTAWHIETPLHFLIGELILICTPIDFLIFFFDWHNANTNYRKAINQVLFIVFNIMIIIEQLKRKIKHDSQVGKMCHSGTTGSLWRSTLILVDLPKPALIPRMVSPRPASKERRTGVTEYKRKNISYEL